MLWLCLYLLAGFALMALAHIEQQGYTWRQTIALVAILLFWPVLLGWSTADTLLKRRR